MSNASEGGARPAFSTFQLSSVCQTCCFGNCKGDAIRLAINMGCNEEMTVSVCEVVGVSLGVGIVLSAGALSAPCGAAIWAVSSVKGTAALTTFGCAALTIGGVGGVAAGAPFGHALNVLHCGRAAMFQLEVGVIVHSEHAKQLRHVNLDGNLTTLCSHGV